MNEVLSRERKGKEKKKNKNKVAKERKGRGRGRIHIAKLTHEVFKREINRRKWEEEKKKAKLKISK